MMPHATIDIETLDTTPQAVILSVGACKFNPYSDDEPHSQQHWLIDIDEQLVQGRTASDSTVAWWAQQDPVVRDNAFSDQNRVSIMQFAKALNKWLVGTDKIWCQGPQFDMVILENLFNQIGVTRNWAYWQVCDSRTVFNLMPVDPRKGIRQSAHDALADALSQSRGVQRTFRHFQVVPR